MLLSCLVKKMVIAIVVFAFVAGVVVFVAAADVGVKNNLVLFL